MAKKKPDAGNQEGSEGILTAAAKAIGTAAGKIASVVKPSSTPQGSPPRGKLAKKNKSRLPRKLKARAKGSSAKRGSHQATAKKRR